jgi:hypothetical protein
MVSPMAESLEDTIRESAAGPASAEVDGVKTQQHPLPDQIEADRYLESKKASRRKGLGMAFKKLVPPGTE